MSEWGNPLWFTRVFLREGEPSELKHLSRRRNKKQFSDFPSSGERTGRSPNHPVLASGGVVGRLILVVKVNRSCLESSATEGESPVGEASANGGVS